MLSFFRYLLHPDFRKSLRLTLICIFLVISALLKAQDIQLALYHYHPIFINPAYTGSFVGDWRLSAGYRNQQVITTQPYITAITGFDKQFFLLNQSLGAGLYLVNDQSGIGGLTFTKVYASVAYEKDIGNNIIGIGFQAGFVTGSVNDWGVWDNTTGTFTGNNGEVYFGEKANFIDMNLGLSWRRKFNTLLPKVGLSIMHLNNPSISFFEGKEKQGIQLVLDSRFDWEISDKILLSPLILLKTQRGANQSVAGVDIAYTLQNKRSPVKSVFGGVHLQNGIIENASSVLLQLGTRVKRLDIVLGYENNLGDFGESSGTTGAFEIALLYNSISTVLNTYSIPCERY